MHHQAQFYLSSLMREKHYFSIIQSASVATACYSHYVHMNELRSFTILFLLQSVSLAAVHFHADGGLWTRRRYSLPWGLEKFVYRRTAWSEENSAQRPPSNFCACSRCRVWLFAAPWTVARRAPLCMEFSRQEYWRGLPFPSPGDLPDSGIRDLNPRLLHLLHWQAVS